MYEESFWSKTGEKRIREFMASKEISEEIIDQVISEMDDVISEERWQAQEYGAAMQSFYSG